jgi:Polyketide cyclase / dehydrase and lipid transport
MGDPSSSRRSVTLLQVVERSPCRAFVQGSHRHSLPPACNPGSMPSAESRINAASQEVHAAPDLIFEMIADPSRQPEWDGNDNLATAAPGQRVRSVGDVFSMSLTRGSVRENHVVEFVEGRLIAWKPAEPGQAAIGHLWRWEVTPIDDERSLVVHTYDWTDLEDESRYERARATTSASLAASIDRLAVLVETKYASSR